MAIDPTYKEALTNRQAILSIMNMVVPSQKEQPCINLAFSDNDRHDIAHAYGLVTNEVFISMSMYIEQAMSAPGLGLSYTKALELLSKGDSE